MKIPRLGPSFVLLSSRMNPTATSDIYIYIYIYISLSLSLYIYMYMIQCTLTTLGDSVSCVLRAGNRPCFAFSSEGFLASSNA